jgi:hypothetical protein
VKVIASSVAIAAAGFTALFGGYAFGIGISEDAIIYRPAISIVLGIPCRSRCGRFRPCSGYQQGL